MSTAAACGRERWNRRQLVFLLRENGKLAWQCPLSSSAPSTSHRQQQRLRLCSVCLLRRAPEHQSHLVFRRYHRPPSHLVVTASCLCPAPACPWQMLRCGCAGPPSQSPAPQAEWAWKCLGRSGEAALEDWAGWVCSLFRPRRCASVPQPCWRRPSCPRRAALVPVLVRCWPGRARLLGPLAARSARESKPVSHPVAQGPCAP